MPTDDYSLVWGRSGLSAFHTELEQRWRGRIRFYMQGGMMAAEGARGREAREEEGARSQRTLKTMPRSLC